MMCKRHTHLYCFVHHLASWSNWKFVEKLISVFVGSEYRQGSAPYEGHQLLPCSTWGTICGRKHPSINRMLSSLSAHWGASDPKGPSADIYRKKVVLVEGRRQFLMTFIKMNYSFTWWRWWHSFLSFLGKGFGEFFLKMVESTFIW